LVRAGLVRRIGVSNFGTSLLRDLLSYADIRPTVLQIELHPFLTQETLVRYARQEDMAVVAFSPLGAPSYIPIGMARPDESILDLPPVRAAADRHRRTPAQILLRWGVQRGTVAIPKTSTPERLHENLAIFDFQLSEAEMKAIGALNRNRRFNDPSDFCERAFNTFFPIYE
jgi:D-xylose reductase